MQGALELLDPNKLLGLVDFEVGEKGKLPIVKATVASKINRIRSNIFRIPLVLYANILCQ